MRVSSRTSRKTRKTPCLIHWTTPQDLEETGKSAQSMSHRCMGCVVGSFLSWGKSVQHQAGSWSPQRAIYDTGKIWNVCSRSPSTFKVLVRYSAMCRNQTAVRGCNIMTPDSQLWQNYPGRCSLLMKESLGNNPGHVWRLHSKRRKDGKV